MVYYFRQMKEFQNEELKKAKHYISGQREFKISRLRFLKNKRQSAIVDSVCHDMMLDPDWRNIADLIFKFIEKTIDKKSGDNYNDNYVSTQAHQGGE